MIIQGLNNAAFAYGAAYRSGTQRQIAPASADYADKVSDTVTISDAAKAMMGYSRATAQDAEVARRLAEIKAKPGVERTDADTAYLSKNDKRLIELQEKMKASGLDGFDALTADEVDYMQKAGGFVNTMSQLSSGEKALYDEMVAKGDHQAAHGLMLVAMARMGMGGQQVRLPNGKIFDPGATEVTADNVRNLFKFMFVDPSGSTDRQFEALASYLDQRGAASQVKNQA